LLSILAHAPPALPVILGLALAAVACAMVATVQDNHVQVYRVIVLAGPSGAGKSTILKMMQQKYSELFYEPLLTTTRSPRDKEVDGIGYHFVGEDKFQQLEKEGKLLFVRQASGCYYATHIDYIPKIAEASQAGKITVFETNLADTVAAMKRTFPLIKVIAVLNSTELESRDPVRAAILKTDLASRLRQRTSMSEKELAIRVRESFENISAILENADLIVENCKGELSDRQFSKFEDFILGLTKNNPSSASSPRGQLGFKCLPSSGESRNIATVVYDRDDMPHGERFKIDVGTGKSVGDILVLLSNMLSSLKPAAANDAGITILVNGEEFGTDGLVFPGDTVVIRDIRLRDSLMASIRPAHIEDLRYIVRLRMDHYIPYLKRGDDMSDEGTVLLSFAALLRDPDDCQDRIFVAEYCGQIIGYALNLASPSEHTAEICTVVVHRDFRDRGIGTQLFEQVLSVLRADQRFDRITMEDQCRNKATASWAQRHGFTSKDGEHFVLLATPDRLSGASSGGFIDVSLILTLGGLAAFLLSIFAHAPPMWLIGIFGLLLTLAAVGMAKDNDADLLMEYSITVEEKSEEVWFYLYDGRRQLIGFVYFQTTSFRRSADFRGAFIEIGKREKGLADVLFAYAFRYLRQRGLDFTEDSLSRANDEAFAAYIVAKKKYAAGTPIWTVSKSKLDGGFAGVSLVIASGLFALVLTAFLITIAKMCLVIGLFLTLVSVAMTENDRKLTFRIAPCGEIYVFRQGMVKLRYAAAELLYFFGATLKNARIKLLKNNTGNGYRLVISAASGILKKNPFVLTLDKNGEPEIRGVRKGTLYNSLIRLAIHANRVNYPLSELFRCRNTRTTQTRSVTGVTFGLLSESEPMEVYIDRTQNLARVRGVSVKGIFKYMKAHAEKILNGKSHASIPAFGIKEEGGCLVIYAFVLEKGRLQAVKTGDVIKLSGGKLSGIGRKQYMVDVYQLFDYQSSERLLKITGGEKFSMAEEQYLVKSLFKGIGAPVESASVVLVKDKKNPRIEIRIPGKETQIINLDRSTMRPAVYPKDNAAYKMYTVLQILIEQARSSKRGLFKSTLITTHINRKSFDKKEPMEVALRLRQEQGLGITYNDLDKAKALGGDRHLLRHIDEWNANHPRDKIVLPRHGFVRKLNTYPKIKQALEERKSKGLRNSSAALSRRLADGGDVLLLRKVYEWNKAHPKRKFKLEPEPFHRKNLRRLDTKEALLAVLSDRTRRGLGNSYKDLARAKTDGGDLYFLTCRRIWNNAHPDDRIELSAAYRSCRILDTKEALLAVLSDRTRRGLGNTSYDLNKDKQEGGDRSFLRWRRIWNIAHSADRIVLPSHYGSRQETSDPFTTWLKDTLGYQQLDDKERISLWHKMRHGSKQAKERLLTSFLPFIREKADESCGYDRNGRFETAVSEGYNAAALAIRAFRYSRRGLTISMFVETRIMEAMKHAPLSGRQWGTDSLDSSAHNESSRKTNHEVIPDRSINTGVNEDGYIWDLILRAAGNDGRGGRILVDRLTSHINNKRPLSWDRLARRHRTGSARSACTLAQKAMQVILAKPRIQTVFRDSGISVKHLLPRNSQAGFSSIGVLGLIAVISLTALSNWPVVLGLLLTLVAVAMAEDGSQITDQFAGRFAKKLITVEHSLGGRRNPLLLLPVAFSQLSRDQQVGLVYCILMGWEDKRTRLDYLLKDLCDKIMKCLSKDPLNLLTGLYQTASSNEILLHAHEGDVFTWSRLMLEGKSVDLKSRREEIYLAMRVQNGTMIEAESALCLCEGNDGVVRFHLAVHAPHNLLSTSLVTEQGIYPYLVEGAASTLLAWALSQELRRNPVGISLHMPGLERRFSPEGLDKDFTAVYTLQEIKAALKKFSLKTAQILDSRRNSGDRKSGVILKNLISAQKGNTYLPVLLGMALTVAGGYFIHGPSLFAIFGLFLAIMTVGMVNGNNTQNSLSFNCLNMSREESQKANPVIFGADQFVVSGLGDTCESPVTLLTYKQLEPRGQVSWAVSESDIGKGLDALIRLYSQRVVEDLKGLRNKSAKLLFVGVGRGRVILDLLTRFPGNNFQVYSINEKDRWLYDMRHIMAYLDPYAYVKYGSPEELLTNNNARAKRFADKVAVLFERLHSHHYAVNIAGGRNLASLPCDFDRIIICTATAIYIPNYLACLRKLYGMLKTEGLLYAEIRDVFINGDERISERVLQSIKQLGVPRMVQKLPSDFQVYAIRKNPRIADLKLPFQIIKTMFPLLLVGLGLIFFGPKVLLALPLVGMVRCIPDTVLSNKERGNLILKKLRIFVNSTPKEELSMRAARKSVGLKPAAWSGWKKRREAGDKEARRLFRLIRKSEQARERKLARASKDVSDKAAVARRKEERRKRKEDRKSILDAIAAHAVGEKITTVSIPAKAGLFRSRYFKLMAESRDWAKKVRAAIRQVEKRQRKFKLEKDRQDILNAISAHADDEKISTISIPKKAGLPRTRFYMCLASSGVVWAKKFRAAILQVQDRQRTFKLEKDRQNILNAIAAHTDNERMTIATISGKAGISTSFYSKLLTESSIWAEKVRAAKQSKSRGSRAKKDASVKLPVSVASDSLSDETLKVRLSYYLDTHYLQAVVPGGKKLLTVPDDTLDVSGSARKINITLKEMGRLLELTPRQVERGQFQRVFKAWQVERGKTNWIFTWPELFSIVLICLLPVFGWKALLALPLVLGMCAFESSPAAKRVYTREDLIKIASVVRRWVLQAGNPIRQHKCNGMEFIVSLAIEDARPVWSDPLFQTWTEVGDMANGWLIDAFPEDVPPEIESEVKRWIVNNVAVMPFAEGKRIYGKGRVYVPSSFLWRNASITLLEGTSQEDKLSFVMAAQGISKGIAEKIMRLALPEKIPGIANATSSSPAAPRKLLQPGSETVKKIIFGREYEFPKQIIEGIRPARIEDAEAIYQYYCRYLSDPTSEEPSLQAFRYYLNTTTIDPFAYRFWVYCDSSNIVRGYAMLCFNNTMIELKELVVDENLGHQGIGTCLAATRLEYVENSGFHKVTVNVVNEYNVRIVKKFGFTCENPDSEGRGYYVLERANNSNGGFVSIPVILTLGGLSAFLTSIFSHAPPPEFVTILLIIGIIVLFPCIKRSICGICSVETFQYSYKYRNEKYDVTVSSSLISKRSQVKEFTIKQLKRNGQIIEAGHISWLAFMHQRVVYLERFFPEFPVERAGRGRALLLTLLAETGFENFQIISYASHELQRSWRKLPVEFKPDTMFTFLPDKTPVRNKEFLSHASVIHNKFPLFSFWELQFYNTWCQITAYAQIPDKLQLSHNLLECGVTIIPQAKAHSRVGQVSSRRDYLKQIADFDFSYPFSNTGVPSIELFMERYSFHDLLNKEVFDPRQNVAPPICKKHKFVYIEAMQDGLVITDDMWPNEILSTGNLSICTGCTFRGIKYGGRYIYGIFHTSPVSRLPEFFGQSIKYVAKVLKKHKVRAIECAFNAASTEEIDLICKIFEKNGIKVLRNNEMELSSRRLCGTVLAKTEGAIINDSIPGIRGTSKAAPWNDGALWQYNESVLHHGPPGLFGQIFRFCFDRIHNICIIKK
jgi:guanylate kinase/ribosomal protein S18 acetylase RimI-like enzyme